MGLSYLITDFCYLIFLSTHLARHRLTLRRLCRRDRAAKLQKLTTLRLKLPHVSQAALSAVLTLAKKQELPAELNQRKHIREARDALANAKTPYGNVTQGVPLPRVDGTVLVVPIQAFWARSILRQSIALGSLT